MAPRSEGSARLARKACSAGMQTQPMETTTMDPMNPPGEGESPAPERPAAKMSRPARIERCNPRRGTRSCGATASMSPTTTMIGPVCCCDQPNRMLA
eukprot:6448774-Prymnesium_polylepis.1